MDSREHCVYISIVLDVRFSQRRILSWLLPRGLLFYPEDGETAFGRKPVTVCQTTEHHIPEDRIFKCISVFKPNVNSDLYATSCNAFRPHSQLRHFNKSPLRNAEHQLKQTMAQYSALRTFYCTNVYLSNSRFSLLQKRTKNKLLRKAKTT